MSTEIVHINITEHEATQVVDARELHTKLGVGRDYRHWIADRLETVGAVENNGFWVVAKSAQNSSGGRPAVNHIVSLDVAEHLCMLERTPQGHKYRDYMISCRKSLVAAPADPMQAMLNDPSLMMQGMITLMTAHQRTVQELAIAAPKADALDRLTLAEGLHTMNEASKELGIGLHKLFDLMKDQGVLLSKDGVNVPYQKHIDAKRFVVKTGLFKKSGASVETTYPRVFATAKGLVYLRGLIDSASQIALF